MSTKITIINPNTSEPMTAAVLESGRSVAASDTTLFATNSLGGAGTVESHIDEVWASAGVLEQVARGERGGMDAYVIACFGDTGLAGARELASGPVVGMTEAAIFSAAMIAHRFSIITMPRRTMEQSDRVLRSVGLEHRCTVRAVDVPVAEVEHGSAHLLEIFAENARAAIEEDGAEAIILGCAGLTELVAPLQDLIGVPVIDGVCAAVKLAEALVAQGLSSSRIATYAPSPESAGIRVTWS